MTTDWQPYVFTTSTVPATGNFGSARSATRHPPLSKRIGFALMGMAASCARPSRAVTPPKPRSGLRCGRKGVDGEDLGSGTLGLGPPERGTVDPHAMQDHRKLARHSDLGALHAATLGHLQSPALERREARDPRQQHVGSFLKGGAHHLIADPRDPAAHIRFARLVSLRCQSKERSGIPGP